VRKTFLAMIVILIGLSSIIGCSNNRIEEVVIYKLKNSSTIKKEPISKITDRDIIHHFELAFKTAKKQPGIVDMIEPEYKVILGENIYFLWLNNEHGTIMNIEDTHTIYTLKDASFKRINDVLKGN
jgi:uncharacterized protein YihD (DUF1040 family)